MFFSPKKDSKTRGHEVKLVKDQCRLDIRKYSFSQRKVNEWNKLSSDCITASSVNMFKNKVHLPSGPLAWMANLVKSILCGKIDIAHRTN